MTYIPNWAPIPVGGVPDDHAGRAELGWNDKIVVQFFGNIGRAQGIPTLLEAINGVQNDEVRFLFAGDGTMAPMVAKLASCRNDLAYLGAVPMAENQRVLAMADICLVSLADGMKGLGVPSKSYFNLAADKHLIYIGEKGSEIWRLIEENPRAWLGLCARRLGQASRLPQFTHASPVDLKSWRTSSLYRAGKIPKRSFLIGI